MCYQKSYHGRKWHNFNHINEPTNTFGQLVTIKRNKETKIDVSISPLALGKAPVLLVFNKFESWIPPSGKFLNSNSEKIPCSMILDGQVSKTAKHAR